MFFKPLSISFCTTVFIFPILRTLFSSFLDFLTSKFFSKFRILNGLDIAKTKRSSIIQFQANGVGSDECYLWIEMNLKFSSSDKFAFSPLRYDLLNCIADRHRHVNMRFLNCLIFGPRFFRFPRDFLFQYFEWS
jgi:hypothetical protein